MKDEKKTEKKTQKQTSQLNYFFDKNQRKKMVHCESYRNSNKTSSQNINYRLKNTLIPSLSSRSHTNRSCSDAICMQHVGFLFVKIQLQQINENLIVTTFFIGYNLKTMA